MQINEYYVYIEFKNFLTNEQLKKVKEYINSECYDSDHTCNESLHVDISDESDAEIFNDNFIEKFSDLIK